MYRNYIFDLYGTLADIRTDEESPDLWKKTALWYGEHEAYYNPAELWKRYLALCHFYQNQSEDPYYEIELCDVFRDLFLEKGIEPSADLIAETAIFFRCVSTVKLRLYPWVMPVFKMIREKGGKIYLLSNAQACFTNPELEFLGLKNAFDGIVLSSDAKVRKPGEGIIRNLFETYKLKKKDSIMIGNDQKADIAVAKIWGIDSLYIETETSGKYDSAMKTAKELFKERFEKLPELLELC